MISVKFDARDAYVGLYWNVASITKDNKKTETRDDFITDRTLYVYVHVIPFLRIVFSKKLTPILGQVD